MRRLRLEACSRKQGRWFGAHGSHGMLMSGVQKLPKCCSLRLGTAGVQEARRLGLARCCVGICWHSTGSSVVKAEASWALTVRLALHQAFANRRHSSCSCFTPSLYGNGGVPVVGAVLRAPDARLGMFC